MDKENQPTPQCAENKTECKETQEYKPDFASNQQCIKSENTNNQPCNKPECVKTQPCNQPTREKKTEVKKPLNPTIPLAISIFAIACSLTSVGVLASLYQRLGTGVTTYNSGSDGNSASFTEGSIADIAQKVSPSVVSIVTETRTTSWYGSYSSTAAGTGFIATEDGLVITNKHVVEGARSVNVILDDGTQYENVTVVGTDPLNDVAILKIDGASGLKAATLGDSKTAHVGEQVITIGNALGAYQNSVAYGIISGTGRSLTASDSSGSSYESLTDMLQTDAAINGGNSGGPLVNAAGEVIGINTAYASDSNNIGFAIPISGVKGLLRDVQKTGKVQRAVLGVRYYGLTPMTAKEANLDVNYGAYITSTTGASSIIPGGAGDKAGLKDGDVILSVNGVKIGAAGSLSTLVGEYSVGDTVQLVVHRNGKDYTTNATLQAYTE